MSKTELVLPKPWAWYQLFVLCHVSSYTSVGRGKESSFRKGRVLCVDFLHQHAIFPLTNCDNLNPEKGSDLEELETLEMVVTGIYGRSAKTFILVVVEGVRS
jgi:hypothetical protein